MRGGTRRGGTADHDGAAEAWQQIQALQGELHKRFEVHHQPAPATLVHMPEGGEGGDEDEEEQRKRAASRQMGQPAPGSRNRRFRAGSVFV